MSQKRPTRKKHASVLPSWLSGYSDDDATEGGQLFPRKHLILEAVLY